MTTPPSTPSSPTVEPSPDRPQLTIDEFAEILREYHLRQYAIPMRLFYGDSPTTVPQLIRPVPDC